MRPALATALALSFLVSGVLASPFATPPAAADPWPTDSGDGTSLVRWNFSNPSDYSLSGTEILGGNAGLQLQTGSWNSTTGSDFGSPDGATNVNWTRFPGNVVVDSVAGPSSLVTIQPDGAAGSDSYLDRGNPGTNYGAATTMVFDPRGVLTTRRPILQFSLASIPAGAVIDDATLSLYQSAASGNSPVAEVHAVSAAWDEAQVTWNNRLTGTAWGSVGGDFDPHVIDQLTLTATLGWKAWNVTQLVDLWYRGRLANQGLILTGPTTGPSFDKTFWTSDYTVDPSLRPKLEVRYRMIGATGEYISLVGGPGSPVAWQSISWNLTERSFVTDEFDGPSLDPKWTWTNPPSSYDVGTTTPGSLHTVSTTGGDLDGTTFTGNVLTNEVVGNFTAITKISGDPTVAGQKHGLMVLLNSRNWYAIQKVNINGSVNWVAKSTADATSAIRANATSGNPVPAWFRIVRSGNAFTASTSPDGVAWTTRDTYTPAFEYPLQVRIGLFLADGLSGTSHSLDVDYVRLVIGTDATVAASSRTGNTSTVDASWSGWSASYGVPSGSPMAGSTSYAQYRLSFSVAYPDHTPNVGDVNISWTSYVPSGTIETEDFVPGDLSAWESFDVVDSLNGQTIDYVYSTDSGGSWSPVTPPQSLLGVSIATGTIRFRATLSTAMATATPSVSEMRLTYRHALDGFYVTAPATASADAVFSLSVSAKDAGNATMAWWTGTVALEAVLVDGTTPATGVLGVTSVPISSGGTVTVATENYTKAETIRIRASAGAISGLSGPIDVSPGPLSRVDVTPNDVTILPLDSQVLTASGYDAWDNGIGGLAFSWIVTGGVGSLNTSAGPSVNFTASGPPANGTVEATAGGITGIAQVHVVSGIPPWVVVSAPANGAHLTGTVTIGYTASANAVSIRFEYSDGAAWTTVGTTSTLNGTFVWDTTGLDFVGGSLRANVTSNRGETNTTIVAPLEVDNTAPTITVGPATDAQATSGTITLTYATSVDVVQVVFTYFDGTWNGIDIDTTVDGSYVWTPTEPINGVTIRATAMDEVGLEGADERPGIGNRTIGSNPPSISSIPTLQVRAGSPYSLNLTFYVSDPDTPPADLAIAVADPVNVSVLAGAFPGLSILYATSGTYVVTLWVSDGTDTAWAFLTIVASGFSPPRLLSTPPAVSFDEDAIAADAFGAPAATFFDDPDGDPLTFVALGNRSVHVRVNPSGTVDFWADLDWYGTESMRFRAVDPMGGFAEVGFTVVVRPVNDAPVIAAIPDLTIEAGSTYILDLGPYLSDVDTPPSSLTVTTDSPYVTVNGQILTLAFPAEWTNVEIRITVSDGAAVALQTVRVAFAVIPAWWSSPYVLAIPPIGVFVVVALFAQRARWRPAKAFLVDERSRMIREFTLDSACRVTYDEAVKAGALDAVEKPVRVAKYHAQTVRGDALAVVLLAYGPVSLEQVEFAREMLVQIQDKFEDSVRARLEEARAYEAELESRAKNVADGEATMETRATEIDSMLRQVEAAQAQVSTDMATIVAKDESLAARERQLADDRRANDDLARQLEGLRTSLDERTAVLEGQAGDIARKEEALAAREEAIAPAEAALAERDRTLAEAEAALRLRGEDAEKTASDLAAREATLEERGASLAQEEDRLAAARGAFEKDQKDLLAFRATVDSRVAEVESAEADLAAKRAQLEEREACLGPLEAALSDREAALAERETNIQAEIEKRAKHLEEREAQVSQEAERLRLKGDEVEQALRTIEERSKAVEIDRASAEELRTKLGEEREALESRVQLTEEALQKRKEELDAQARAVGEGQLKLSQDAQAFEEMRTARSHWIASKEIELESREQALVEKENAIRSQAEQNAQHLTDLASREETLEVEADRIEKDRAEIAARKAELDKISKNLETRGAQLRAEEVRNAEEHRTWQATLESEQGLLRSQQETFEKEAADLRTSWADRMQRLQEREEEASAREEKIRTDIEWIARAEDELTRREKEAQGALAATARMQAEIETTRKDLEQRALELETRERSLREEAAKHADELTRRQADLRQAESRLDAQRAETEHELAARVLKVQEAEAELGRKDQAHDAKAQEITGREARLASLEDSLRQEQERLARERTDLQVLAEQLDAREVELTQQRQRHTEEVSRFQAETESTRQSLATKVADLHTERERLERESVSLQDRLGAKAQELVSRERSVAAREEELRSEEQDLETRIRAVESQERQAEGHAAEIAAQTVALGKRQTELDARGAQMDAAARQFASDEAERKKEWESLRVALKSQEAQMNATAESRMAQLSKQMTDIEVRERSLAATAAQLAAERTRLAAASKAQEAKDAEANAAMARAEKRFQELKLREAETLQIRQSFESERSVWASRRAEELKQLEATRDATAEQTQKAERLLQEAQRRALLANDAERAAKRKEEEAAAVRVEVERQRVEAEQIERNLQVQNSQFQEMSRKIALKEAELAARARDFQADQARLATAQMELSSSIEALKARQVGLDAETSRLSQIAANAEARMADAQARARSAEAKMAEVIERERVLTTELQRAENLMEDLGRKTEEIRAREKEIGSIESDLARRNAAVAQKEADLREGMSTLDNMRRELEGRLAAAQQDRSSAATIRDEAVALRSEAERERSRIEAMDKEVSKNMKFLQKKAVDVLDKEEKVREREQALQETEKSLEVRSEILESKERELEADRAETLSRLERAQAEVERLKQRLAQAEKAALPTAEMEDWKKEIDNRVKIIQRKAMDLLDREETLRKKQDELQALAEQLGVKL
jgi:regulation of enolase protein 1 (concanavalin A-like superfamily)/chromosome segregation ATPase